MIDISSFGAIGDTSLTSEAEIVMLESGLPSTFVPGRNLVFFVYAAALGYRRGLTALVGGMCETDYSGYPDCRDATLRALQEAIRLGTEVPFSIDTPLMWRSKAETWALAQELGGAPFVDLILEETHTCYKGERGTRHAWGYGCGECPACALRAKGYAEWQAIQPRAPARLISLPPLPEAKSQTTAGSDGVHTGCGTLPPSTGNNGSKPGSGMR